MSVDIMEAGINFMHPDVLAKMQEQQLASSTVAEFKTEPKVEPQQVPKETPVEQAAPPAPETTPARKYAGKYTSVEEFEKGYWNSAQEAQRLAAENKALKEILTSGQRVNPAERAAERETYVDELREAAIPVEALEKLIDARAKRATREELAPIARGAQARYDMIERFPGYEKAEREITKFLSANPDVNDKYNRMMSAGLEDAASEYVYLNFERQNNSQTITSASGQEQAVARATASLPGGAVGAREVSNTYLNQLQAARERFARDGDERALAAVVLAGIHPGMQPAS